MRHKLKRYYGYGHLHFVTFSCYQRRALLGNVRARNIFVRILGEVRDKHRFLLVGYVVMPDHVHLLIGEPQRGTVSTVLQVLKQRVSRAIRGKRRQTSERQLELRFSAPARKLPRLWQRRFYDFNVWSWRKRREKLDYMHGNPVKRKIQIGSTSDQLAYCGLIAAERRNGQRSLAVLGSQIHRSA